MGAWPAFTISSIILLLAATLLNRSQPSAATVPTIAIGQQPSSPKNLGLVALSGMAITIGVILTQQLIGLVGQAQTPAFMTLFLLVQLTTVLPIGWLSQRLGSLQTMIGGLVLLGCGFLGLLIPMGIAHIIAIMLLGLGLGAVGVGTIPFALRMVPPSRGGLGIGFYFGGAALAGALFNVYMANAKAVPLSAGFSVGCFSLIIAIVTLWNSRSRIR